MQVYHARFELACLFIKVQVWNVTQFRPVNMYRLSAEDASSTNMVQECQANLDLDVDSKLFLGMEM